MQVDVEWEGPVAGTSVTASEVGLRAASRSGLRSSWIGRVEALDVAGGTLELRVMLGVGGLFIRRLHVELSADTVLVSHQGETTFRAIPSIEGLRGTYAFVLEDSGRAVMVVTRPL